MDYFKKKNAKKININNEIFFINNDLSQSF